MKFLYSSLVILIFSMAALSSNAVAGSGDPLKGLDLACAPFGCKKHSPLINSDKETKMAPPKLGDSTPKSDGNIQNGDSRLPSNKGGRTAPASDPISDIK